MTDSEITLSVLREIRDTVRTTNTKLDLFMEQVDKRFEQVDKRFEEVDVQFGHIGIALRDVGLQVMLLARYLKNRTEVDLVDLIERVTKLEAKVG